MQDVLEKKFKNFQNSYSENFYFLYIDICLMGAWFDREWT